jgi:hypothetical protein
MVLFLASLGAMDENRSEASLAEDQPAGGKSRS